MDVVQSVVRIGEDALHSLREAGIADEGTDNTSPAREGWQGQHVGSSVPVLPPQHPPNPPPQTRRVWSTPVTPASSASQQVPCTEGADGRETEARGSPVRRGAAVGKDLHGAPPPRGRLPTTAASSPLSRRAGIYS